MSRGLAVLVIGAALAGCVAAAMDEKEVQNFECLPIVDQGVRSPEFVVHVKATIKNSRPYPVKYALTYNITDSTGAIMGSGTADVTAAVGPLQPGKTLTYDDVLRLATGEDQASTAYPDVRCGLAGVARTPT